MVSHLTLRCKRKKFAKWSKNRFLAITFVTGSIPPGNLKFIVTIHKIVLCKFFQKSKDMFFGELEWSKIPRGHENGHNSDFIPHGRTSGKTTTLLMMKNVETKKKT